MKISYKWLQDYIEEELPEPVEIAKVLTKGAYEVEGLEEINDDVVLDVDVLPDRASDSLSHAGVARDLAALLSLSFTPVDPESKTDKDLKAADFIKLLVGTDKCRRALKRLAVEIEIGKSPDWLRDRLATLGQKSINNVVDITNLVMFELGQPVHAFDYDKLTGEEPKNITIRTAKPGEELTTLDGDTYKLTEDMLVIADDEKALDIAGVKGGQMSGIDGDTTRVILSVCSFDPATIRKTSQQLGLRTDASKRFENNVPADLSRQALERFSQLIVEVAGGRVSADVCDVYPQPEKAYKVGVLPDRVNQILGTDIETDNMTETLTRLGCQVELITPQKFITESAEDYVGIPYEYGASVLRDGPEKFDCSSFTSWLYVQGGVALPRMTADQFVYTEEITKEELRPGDLVFSNTEKQEGGEIYHESQEYMPGTKIPDGVDHCGIYLGDGRVIHTSRHNLDEAGGVEIEDLATAKQFQNITKYGRVAAVDKEHIVATIPAWRTDLRVGADLIEEIGRIYGYDNIAATLPKSDTAGPRIRSNVGVMTDVLVSLELSEVKTYSLVANGEIKVANPVAEDKAYLRTTLRDNLETLLEKNQPHLPVLEAESLCFFEIGQVFTGEDELTEVVIAVSGKEADTTVAKKFEALSDMIGIDIDPDIRDGIGTATFKDIEDLDLATVDLPIYREVSDNSFRLPSSFPYVLRDIAVWTPAGTKPEDVKEIIQESAGELLVATKLFDTYEKEEQISYAFKLVFQSDDRTLSDAEVNEHMQDVEKALEGNEEFSVR